MAFFKEVDMQRFFDYRIYVALASLSITLGMSLVALGNHMKAIKLEDELVRVYSDKFTLEKDLHESSRKNAISEEMIFQLQSAIAGSKK